jgi:hypothetical protein
VVIVKKVMSILAFLVLVPFAYGANVYEWVDRSGVINFTDDINKVPPSYRSHVEAREFPPESGTSPPPPELAPQASLQPKEAARDIYGMGEDWWRDKAGPWHRQLKEAAEKYESVNQRINETLEELRGRFLTSTQMNMLRVEIDQLLDERSRLEAQAKGANEMLDKIATEAQEARANPDWVK